LLWTVAHQVEQHLHAGSLAALAGQADTAATHFAQAAAQHQASAAAQLAAAARLLTGDYAGALAAQQRLSAL
jgi:hypothetical protein